MSREIKFRIWRAPDEYDKTFWMESWDSLMNYSMSDIFQLDNPDDVLEQYTGIKDKNGKDIYEGDIVQYENEEDMKFSVTFKQGIFYACNTLGSEFMVDTFLGSLAIGNRLKVIGNAHQNPELVEAEK